MGKIEYILFSPTHFTDASGYFAGIFRKLNSVSEYNLSTIVAVITPSESSNLKLKFMKERFALAALCGAMVPDQVNIKGMVPYFNTPEEVEHWMNLVEELGYNE